MSRLRGNETGAIVLWKYLVMSVSPCAPLPISFCFSLSSSILPGHAHWGSPGGGKVVAARGILRQPTLEFLNYRGHRCFPFTASHSPFFGGKYFEVTLKCHASAFTHGVKSGARGPELAAEPASRSLRGFSTRLRAPFLQHLSGWFRDSGSPAARWWRRREDPERPERLQGKARRPGAPAKGTGKPFLGQREWARQTEAGEKLKSKDGSTGEVAGEARKEVGRLSRREDQLPILRVPQVDFDSRSSPVWMVKSCPGFHPTKTLQSPFAASLLNWNSWPSWPGLREAAPLLSRASKLLPRQSSLPLLSAPTSLNLNFSLRNDPVFRHATSSCVPGRANWLPPLKERKQRPHAG